ncbi:MAG: GNAT family N-acetyltransferase [Muribaculaceae bacterium]|nr:GNAT family N-acetyltransferase [Muribaculaceae bacterium]
MKEEIRKATVADLGTMMDIYRAASARMAAAGNAAQWVGGYPSELDISSDIERGVSYVIERFGSIAGVFAFIIGEDPSYRDIEGAWPSAAPYGTIHRLAAAPGQHGIADACLDFCRRFGVDVRVDTHAHNAAMLAWIASRGFEFCGIISTASGSPRKAYHMSVD